MPKRGETPSPAKLGSFREANLEGALAMNSLAYDIVTVGGSLGASAFAACMARRGVRVLILEKETQFKDRVRGEYLCTWGVAEAKKLGIDAALMKSCATEVPFIDMGFGPRNLVDTTSQQLPSISFFHPEMQETLLAEAEQAGAEVRRGVSVTNIQPGTSPSLQVTSNGREEQIFARLVVAADGRGSAARKWAGFPAQKDEHPFHFAGVLLTGVCVRQDMGTFVFNPKFGLVGGIVPQSKDRCRAYLGYPTDGTFALHGSEKLGTFLAQSQKVGPMFADCYARAKIAGPLAAFDAGYVWVDHPYRHGVALLGEAAAVSDPSFGQGMSLTLRDARVLRDALLSQPDWEKAGHSYAEQHDAYFGNMHTVCCWFRSLFQEQGPQADVRRQKAMPLIAEDLSRVPDHLFGGPDLPLDETVRARFFGEC
jgi:2-polyprenyl-6-methoxyphenol hydroxylase-like FAD-dependent oxidoreductase